MFGPTPGPALPVAGFSLCQRVRIDYSTHPSSQLMGIGKIKSADYTINLCSKPANYVANEHAERKKLSKT
jgi:hypothetical protein